MQQRIGISQAPAITEARDTLMVLMCQQRQAMNCDYSRPRGPLLSAQQGNSHKTWY